MRTPERHGYPHGALQRTRKLSEQEAQKRLAAAQRAIEEAERATLAARAERERIGREIARRTLEASTEGTSRAAEVQAAHRYLGRLRERATEVDRKVASLAEAALQAQAEVERRRNDLRGAIEQRRGIDAHREAFDKRKKEREEARTEAEAADARPPRTR